MDKALTNISEAFEGLKIGEIRGIIIQKLDEGGDPYSLIKECQKAMKKIGERFDREEYFAMGLILSG